MTETGAEAGEAASVFVGLGSNEGREAHLRLAVAALRERFAPVRLSPVYESPDSRFGGPPFYNLVAGFRSAMAPAELRACFREIEARCGRVRRRERTFPLDLDLLLYDDRLSDDPKLPHPDILTRAFVLKPLSDLVPDFVHPATGRTLAWHWLHFDRGQLGGLRAVELRVEG